jgi:hypothetical protein
VEITKLNGENTIKCADCGTDLTQEDKQCPKCGSTRKAYTMVATVKIGISVSTEMKHRRPGVKRPLHESVSNRFKKDKDPKLTNGVCEDVSIDRVNDKYDQVVKDAKTGKIIHEEHEALSRHKDKTVRKLKQSSDR